MKILVTGCAGFIGFHTCLKLLHINKYEVYGIDNINNYYDVQLKKTRLEILKKKSQKFKFCKLNINNYNKILNNFNLNKYNIVIHLAAQAGVRKSLEEPEKYFDSNLKGFFNILESSRLNKIKHFIFASSSSVYGSTKKFPLKEEFDTDKPLSFYAATKKCNEIMAYSYSNIYKLPSTGLRFFTVYGPYGRPDMSLFKFTSAIINSKTIDLFNRGNHVRDFTYIDDVVGAIVRLIKKPSNAKTPFEIYNIASNNPIHLKDFLKIIQSNLSKVPRIKLHKFQLGDVHKTHASIKKLNNKIKYKPKVSINKGVEEFIKWYKRYFK